MDNLVKLSQRPFQMLAGFCFLGGTLFMLRIMLGFIMPGGILSEVTLGLVLNAIFFFSLMTLFSFLLISCGGGGGDTSAVNPPPTSNEVTKTLTGLQSGTTYYWKVVADDGKGGVAESEVRSFTTQ